MRSLVRDVLAEADGRSRDGDRLRGAGSERRSSSGAPSGWSRSTPTRPGASASAHGVSCSASRPTAGRSAPIPRRRLRPRIDGGSDFAVLDTRGLDWDEEETIALLAQAARCAIVTRDPGSASPRRRGSASSGSSRPRFPPTPSAGFVTREVVVLAGRGSR